eukprot:649989-Rhodomonas_salina.2
MACTLQAPIQETAFLVQFVLRMRFLEFDFGVRGSAGAAVERVRQHLRHMQHPQAAPLQALPVPPPSDHPPNQY